MQKNRGFCSTRIRELQPHGWDGKPIICGSGYGSCKICFILYYFCIAWESYHPNSVAFLFAEVRAFEHDEELKLTFVFLYTKQIKCSRGLSKKLTWLASYCHFLWHEESNLRDAFLCTAIGIYDQGYKLSSD